MQSLGDRIRNLRKARHMTQEQLAGKCYLSISTISRWENGSLQPNANHIQVLAEALEVTAHDLFPTSDALLPEGYIIRKIVSALEQLSEDEQWFILETLERYQIMKQNGS